MGPVDGAAWSVPRSGARGDWPPSAAPGRFSSHPHSELFMQVVVRHRVRARPELLGDVPPATAEACIVADPSSHDDLHGGGSGTDGRPESGQSNGGPFKTRQPGVGPDRSPKGIPTARSHRPRAQSPLRTGPCVLRWDAMPMTQNRCFVESSSTAADFAGVRDVVRRAAGKACSSDLMRRFSAAISERCDADGYCRSVVSARSSLRAVRAISSWKAAARLIIARL